MKMENKTTDGKVQQYLELLEEIRSKVGDEVVAVEILHEISKDRRMEYIRAERKAWVEVSHDNGDNGMVPASAKQLAFLKDLKIEVPRNCSKQEASRLLDEAIAQRV